MNSGIHTPGGRRTEILAPVNAVDEVDPLLDAGAAWLYGGVIPSEWDALYPSTVLLNQRTFPSAQFSSLEELAAAAKAVRDRGGDFALTLNAPFYMDDQMPLALDLARWALDYGVSALIVADPGLLSRLREERLEISLHLSTMGLAVNAQAVKMYMELGIARVILPRFLDLAGISDLTAEAPDVQYEAFILVGKCPNIEGVCTFVHDSPDRRWPCEWSWHLEEENGALANSRVRAHFKGVQGSDRRDGCGLCALPKLLASGVFTFKVVGRGAPLSRKVGLVEGLSRLARKAPEHVTKSWVEECREVYSSLFGHPCTPHNCYYPEVTETD